MKRILLLSLFLLACKALVAQDRLPVVDSVKNPKIFISGLGGIISETSVLSNSLSDCIGAAGAFTINHYFFIGAYGLSLTTNHPVNDLVMYNKEIDSTFYGQKLRTNFTHAGIWAGFIFFPKKTVHLGISTKLGWGSIRLVKNDVAYVNNVNYLLDYMNDNVMVVTPEIDVEIAITSWLKCNLGLGYRFVKGIDFIRYKNFGFSAPQFSVGLYFGGFYNKKGENDDLQTGSEEEQ